MLNSFLKSRWIAPTLVIAALACGAAWSQAGTAAWNSIRTAKWTTTVTLVDFKAVTMVASYKAPDKMRFETADRVRVQDSEGWSLLDKSSNKRTEGAYQAGTAPEVSPEKLFSADYAVQQWNSDKAIVKVQSERTGMLGDKQCIIVVADVTPMKRRGRTIIGPQHLTVYMEPDTRLLLRSDRDVLDSKTGHIVCTVTKVVEYNVDLPEGQFATK